MALIDELAAIRADMDLLVFEAAQRRGMTVDEWQAWWADPDNRRRLSAVTVRAPSAPPAVRAPRPRTRPEEAEV